MKVRNEIRLYMGQHGTALFIGFAMTVCLASNPILGQQPRNTPKRLENDASKLQEAVRQSIQKSVPFIEDGGQKWIKKMKCVTCHQVPYMVWALNSATQSGFDVDQEGLAHANEWSAKWKNLTKVNLRSTAKETQTLLEENDAIATLLLGMPPSEKEEANSWPDNYRDHLIQSQLSNGAWEPKGQLPKQKRPFRETREVSTMWALLAIGRETGLDDEAHYFIRAQKWLDKKTKGVSTEWWATRLLLERSIGNEKAADELRRALLSKQNKDGGWGWLCSGKSDAFGTGIAIYALTKDGLSPNESSISNAMQFLTKTQNENGSWSVNGTKNENRSGPSSTSNYWGTCWAVIGLLETLEQNTEHGIPQTRATEIKECQPKTLPK